jgi:hypothetical protein
MAKQLMSAEQSQATPVCCNRQKMARARMVHSIAMSRFDYEQPLVLPQLMHR